MEVLTTPVCGVLLQPIAAMIEWPAGESSRERVNKSLKSLWAVSTGARSREDAENKHVKRLPLLIGVVSEIVDLDSSGQCLMQRLPIPAQLILPEPARLGLHR
jgi:hypothetical protein